MNFFDLEKLFGKSKKADNMLQQVVEDEMSVAIEEARPQIKELCKIYISNVIEELSVEKAVKSSFTSRDFGRKIDEQLEETLEYYDDEIRDILWEILSDKLKKSSLKDRE